MILTTNNGRYEFEISPRDYPLVSSHVWHFQRYLRTEVGGKIVRLHNLILGPAPTGKLWDHKDRNVLNNRRSNLRLVTHIESQRNRGVPRNNKTSGVKGVCFVSRDRRWYAYIKVNRKMINLGYYGSREEAIAARVEGERKYWG